MPETLSGESFARPSCGRAQSCRVPAERSESSFAIRASALWVQTQSGVSPRDPRGVFPCRLGESWPQKHGLRALLGPVRDRRRLRFRHRSIGDFWPVLDRSEPCSRRKTADPIMSTPLHFASNHAATQARCRHRFEQNRVPLRNSPSDAPQFSHARWAPLVFPVVFR
jgi:hypothetical protein